MLADGAGGMSGGAEAADAVVAAVASAVDAGQRGDWASVLAEADTALTNVGQTTAVVAEVMGGAVEGASVGDSGAWLIRLGDIVDLTDDQQRKPLLGCGQANPVRFEATLTDGDVLVVASDGLFKYAQRAAIAEICRAGISDDVHQLVELARLPNGSLPDDDGVFVLRRPVASSSD